MDIATGYLEIGGLLDIDQSWQQVDKIRIILGNEVTRRTQEVIETVKQAFLDHLSDSIDAEQEHNEFLTGVPAIIEAMKSRKIECRVYDREKFHAKAYITQFRDDYRDQFISSMNVPPGYALVGSSNFTHAGLTKNIELNVQLDNEVEELQAWFDEHWEEGTDITEAVLKVIEKHCREFSPYDVYLRSMYEYFKSREETISEWENHESVIYKELAQYQRDGYNSLIEIANRYSGAFLCDGVGLGKTFVGMMLIERFVKKERKNVVLMVPAAARVSVWETTINMKKYIILIMTIVMTLSFAACASEKPVEEPETTEVEEVEEKKDILAGTHWVCVEGTMYEGLGENPESIPETICLSTSLLLQYRLSSLLYY